MKTWLKDLLSTRPHASPDPVKTHDRPVDAVIELLRTQKISLQEAVFHLITVCVKQQEQLDALELRIDELETPYHEDTIHTISPRVSPFVKRPDVELQEKPIPPG